jgi:hypothetical protein
VITPAPTVILPSRITKRKPIFNAVFSTSWTETSTESPGITVTVSSGNIIVPVTLAVLKKNVVYNYL